MAIRSTFAVSLIGVVLLLCGCDSSSSVEESVEDNQARTARLVAATPHRSQVGVNEGAELRLVFDQSPEGLRVEVAAAGDASSSPELEVLTAEAFELRYRMLGLAPGTEYSVSVVDSATDQTIDSFSFLAAGPRSLDDSIPSVVFSSPIDSAFPLSRASNLHLVFSQWMDESALNDEDIQLFSGADPLDIVVKMQQDRMTITPASGFDSEGPFTLRLSNLVDLHGQELPLYEVEFEVEELGELSRLNVVSSDESSRKSFASLESALLGANEISFQAETGVYLGDPAMFEGYNPIVLKKGTQFTGSSIELLLSGSLPTGLDSETMRFTLLDDAVGYISKNQYTDNFSSPQTVSFIVDLSVSSDEPRVNALITQDLLAVQLSGRSMIEEDQLLFELSGVAQLDVLDAGEVDASITLSLETTDLEVLDNVDHQAPSLVSSRPYENQSDVDTQQALHLYFDEALYASSVASQVSLHRSSDPGNVIPISVSVNGAEVVISPESELEDTESYFVNVATGVKDLAGNSLLEPAQFSFSTGQSADSFYAAPRLTSVYPGVACALESSDLVGNIAGRCREVSGVTGQRYSVFTLPADQSLSVGFSTQIQASSLTLAESCGQSAAIRVERVDWSSGSVSCLEAVAGSASFDGMRWDFSPDQPLLVGGQYQLVINGGGSLICSTDQICGVNDRPLDTRPIDTSWLFGGGGDVVIPFVAEEARPEETFQVLQSAEVADSNGNHDIGSGESTSSNSKMTLKIDICDQSSCSYGSICDYPGDPTPSSSRYSCNADSARTRIGTAISFNSSNTLFTTADLPVRLKAPLYDESLAAEYIPVEIPAAILPVTEFEMGVTALWIVGNDIDTGPLYLRVRQEGSEGNSSNVQGRIIADPNSTTGGSMFKVELNTYLDAPSLAVPSGGSHDLKNRELNCKLSGPIEFDDQGQMKILLRNEEVIKIPMSITGTTLGAGNGDIVFEIEAGQFQLDLRASK